MKQSQRTYCLNCGSVLGLHCGDAEPDYNGSFCSTGCFLEEKHMRYIKAVCAKAQARIESERTEETAEEEWKEFEKFRQCALFTDYRGLPSSLYRELLTHMTQQVSTIPESITELYSAISRPGSWEWHTEDGRYVREILKHRGYYTIPDPTAAWRVIWKKWATESEALEADEKFWAIKWNRVQPLPESD